MLQFGRGGLNIRRGDKVGIFDQNNEREPTSSSRNSSYPNNIRQLVSIFQNAWDLGHGADRGSNRRKEGGLV